MLIDGQWVGAASGNVLQVKDPYDQSVWATVPAADATDVDRAVQAANRAFAGPWRELRPMERAELLRRLAAKVEENEKELGLLQVRENGKLHRELAGQARLMSRHLYFYAGLAESTCGETTAVSVPHMLNYTNRAPMGVVAAITPWNSPLLLLAWKLGPALAAGNTLVVKPSEVSPISTLLLARLALEAGFPPGVINVVTGLGDAGAALVAHPGVRKIAFTGSTGTGKSIAGTAAERLARVTLELGGKSPNIIFDDANQEAAVKGVMAGIFGATGQSCMAGSRILLQRTIAAEFTDRLLEAVGALQLGDPLDPNTEIGPVACEPQYNKVLSYVQIAEDEGAKRLCGGIHPETPNELRDGLFVKPTIFGSVTNDMRIAQEEVFGPIACLLEFSDEEEAVRVANDTRFGLAAGVWTENVGRAHRVANQLEAGTVWINTYRRTNYVSPFGGFKESGVGRENGARALEDYTEMRSVWVNQGGAILDPFNPRA